MGAHLFFCRRASLRERTRFFLSGLCARAVSCGDSDICDAADAIEATLTHHPDMQQSRDEIKQACASQPAASSPHPSSEAARHTCA